MPVLFLNPMNPNETRVQRIAYDTTGWTEEDLRGGIVVDSIPEPENNGKIATLHINKDTKEMWYEYEEVPLTPEQIMQNLQNEIAAVKARNAELEKSQADQDELLMQLMLSKGGN